MTTYTMSRRVKGAVLGVTTAAVLSTGLAACGTPQGSSSQASASTTAAVTQIVPVSFTSAQTAELKSLTDSPKKLESVVATLNASFGKTLTASTKELTSSNKVINASYSSLNPDLVYGYNGHFWVIASYADMASGAIWAGVRSCSTRLPGWLCSYLGNVLASWANGWGWGTNHGVWGAVYWDRITGGRW